jgi:NAD(P)-dependent dehydrogenase (short-subunit alcohol dehydrogenase family)
VVDRESYRRNEPNGDRKEAMADTTFGPRGWTPERLGPQDGKTFLITGANAGTGFEATRILLGKGAKVVMLNRSAERSEAAVAKLKEELGTDAQVTFVRMDLAELDSVRNAAAEVQETVPQIDALICNAAVAQVPTQKLTVDGFESMLGTNHYGHFLLSGLLFERIADSKGRIVVVASLGYKMGIKTIQFDDMNWDENYHQNKTYSQSKLAQMMFAYELQDRLEAANKDVRVYVCHPGSSRTSLITTSGNLVTRVMFRLMSMSPMVQSAEKGAYPEVMCATEDGLAQKALYGPTGRNEWVGPVGKGTLEPFAYDKPVMERLWSLSEKETGFDWKL